MAAQRVLIICPAFHGYGYAVGHALEQLGHEVTVHDYDALTSRRRKLQNKALFELPAVVGVTAGLRARDRSQSLMAVRRVLERQHDVLLVIRGDTLDGEFWEAAAASRARVVLWLYDELRRMNHVDETLRSVDVLVTYSPKDAEELRAAGLPVHHLANAFDTSVVITPDPSDSVVFVGARYPNREEAMTTLHRAGVPVLGVGRDWSHHPADRLRTWDLRRPNLPALRDVPRARAYALMAGAPATLNIHTDQDGFTMRTFEACGSAALQLIDRPDVATFYEPGKEIAVFNSPEEMVDLAARAVRDRGWSRRMGEAARRRTLAEHTFVHRAQELVAAWG